MKRRAFLLPILCALLLCGTPGAGAATVKSVLKKMGSRFEITAVHPDRSVAEHAVQAAWAEIDRIEAMISSWREDSETSAVNRSAGLRPVAVSPELFNLARRALKVSDLTGGAFDITFAGAGRLWDFKAATPRLPHPEEIRRAIARVDYQKVALDEAARTIFLREPGMAIGFGAIGKGYAANRAAHVLRENGIENATVNAGGDLLGLGRREDGGEWEIGIAHPRNRDHVFARLKVHDQAVVTSGDYESFVIIDGKRYGHIIDPKTGYPADHLQSVTIICPDAELADALATATFVMGPVEGMKLVDSLNAVEALFVDRDGKLIFSENVESHFVDPKEAP